MTEDSYKLLEWGLEEESCLPIKSQSLGTVVQFREKEFLVLGQKEITRFESTLVKESYPYVLTALVPIPKYDILIGVTAVSAEFIILFMSDLKQNLMTGVKVNDRSVFNIIYSTKSDTIITSGEHLITWSFQYSPPESSVVFTYPTVNISMKKIILSHVHSSIMNPPMFDYSHEELYINDNKGSIQSYNLNGFSNGIAIKYGSTTQAACGFYAKTQYFMTTNASQGAVLWPKRTGGISKRFFIGTSASLAIQFIDDEYVVILDAKYTITIIDIKTSNFVNCYQSNFPINRMFYFQKPYPRLVLCAGSTVILLKINLPWRFWNPTFGKPISITRSNKKDEAARITVVLENSHVRLISPKTSSILTAATLTSLATPITCFYDRGITEQQDNKNSKRDQLLIPLQDGPMQIFSTGQDPCQMISSIDIKVTSICQCKFRNEWCFCFGTGFGQLLFYSYSTMKSVGRIVCNYKYPIIGTFYDKESECLILAFNERVCLLSLKTEKEVGDYTQMKCSKVSLFFDRILIFAGEKGVIKSLYVLNQQILLHETNSMRLHDDTITGFSLGSTFFVSSSIDKTVKVWSKDFHAICKIVLPLPIQKCCVMNGKRDILAATISDIMIIKGSDIFGEYLDLEDEVYDNYDRKTDSLDNSFLTFPEEEDKGESILAGRKKKEEEKKKGKVNARRKRIIEALKKQMQLMEQKNKQIENQIEEIDNNNKQITTNLPKNQNDQQNQKKEENSSQKSNRKSDDSSSYEYVVEEEEDRKSNSSQPVVQKEQKQNEKIVKEKDENHKASHIDKEKEKQKEKEEIERKRKLLEKQKADKEKEEKEKEILKMYNDANRAKEIKEPTTNSKPRSNRHKALQLKVSQPSNENEEDKIIKINDENELTNENQNEDDKKDDVTKSKQKLSSKKKNNKSKNGTNETDQKEDENSNSKENEKEEKLDKSNSKNKTKKTFSEKNQKKSKTNNNENQNQDENDNSSQKSKNKDKKKCNSKTSNKEENNNDNKSNKTKEDKKDQNKPNSIINEINDNKKDTNNNGNIKSNKNKNDETPLEKSNKNNKNKINEKISDKSNQTTKNKENESSSKTKSQKTTKKKVQTINPKKGYKNASSQTVDPSSLQKICDVPKTVPSNVAIVPQIAKARRVRRSPTPPTNRPQRERRPLFDQNTARKRSRTPEPLRLLVDGSAPPVNLFFDINMVKKMVENGDQRYVPLLQLLERQGLKSNNFSSLPLQRSNRVLQQKNLRKGAAHFASPSSWGVMVTVPPINVSQIKMKTQSNNNNNIISEESTNKKLLEESNQLSLNNIYDASTENESNKDEAKSDQKNEINQEKSSGFKFTNLNDFNDKLSENEYSYGLYQDPVSLLYNNNQALSMKKMQKLSNKSRGSSVPNVNKTVAEMKFCKEQLMQKIKEKRAKETNQNDLNEKETDSKSSNSSLKPTTNHENNKEQTLILNKNENENNCSDQTNIINDIKLNQNESEAAINKTNENQAQFSTKSNTARFGSLNLNPRFSNQMTSNPASARAPTFVEPIMPIYLRASKDVRYIKQDGISPFACKRYRMVVDSNGPRDAKNFPSHRTNSKSVNNSKKTLIDQYVKPPSRQLLKPLQMVKAQSKH